MNASGARSIAEDEELVDITFEHRRDVNAATQVKTCAYGLAGQRGIPPFQIGHPFSNLLNADLQHFDLGINRDGEALNFLPITTSRDAPR